MTLRVQLASQQVADIYELREEVLRYLPAPEILRAQRISQAFRFTIRDSRILQQALYKRPWDGVGAVTDPAILRRMMNWLVMGTYPPNPRSSCHSCLATVYFDARPMNFKVDRVKVCGLKLQLQIWTIEQARGIMQTEFRPSWLDMYLTQRPTPIHLSVTYNRSTCDNEFRWLPTGPAMTEQYVERHLHRDEKVTVCVGFREATLGEVFTVAARIVLQDQDTSQNYYPSHDYKRPPVLCPLKNEYHVERVQIPGSVTTAEYWKSELDVQDEAIKQRTRCRNPRSTS